MAANYETYDIFIRNSVLLKSYLDVAKKYHITAINEKWSVLGISSDEWPVYDYSVLGFNAIPDLYTLSEDINISEAGIYRVRRQPGLNLTGEGVLIGIVDTGIDYLHEAFINEDGTSKIEYIEDQSDETELGFAVYENSEINRAISEYMLGGNPYLIVPQKDDNGHGTAIAGIAAGREMSKEDFSGVAPLSGLAVVKLRQAKDYLKSFYHAVGTECYSEADIILGIMSLCKYADSVSKPIVILIGMGNTLGSHNAGSVLSDVLADISGNVGRCVVVAAGNEALSRLHCRQIIEKDKSADFEIKFEKSLSGLWVNFWLETGTEYGITVISPTGQSEGPLTLRPGRNFTLRYLLDDTVVRVYFGINEGVTEQSFCCVDFLSPMEGNWLIKLSYANGLGGVVDAWLPSGKITNYSAFFLNSDPDITYTEPGGSKNVVTVGGIDVYNDSSYGPSGRGFTPMGAVKPEIVCGAVNVMAPDNIFHDRFVAKTGTSMAAAIAAGAAAMLFEYGIIKRNSPFMRTYTIKNNFILSAKRKNTLSYPNTVYGYGELDLYNIFFLIR